MFEAEAEQRATTTRDVVAAIVGLVAAGNLLALLISGALHLTGWSRGSVHVVATILFLLLAAWPALLFGADGRVRAVWRFFDGMLALVAANAIAGGLGYAIAGKDIGPLFDLIFRPVAMVLAIAGFCVLLRGIDRVRSNLLAAQGLPLDRTALRDAAVGVLLAFALITGCWLAIRVWGNVTYVIEFTPSLAAQLLVELVMLAAAAMLEEVGFRGYPFQRLVESAGPVVAILVLSTFFGLVHRNNPSATAFSVINTALIGAVFCVAYLRTRALWFPFGLHWGWNTFLGVLYGLPVSGVDMTMGIKGRAEGPAWLTGGSYGIEAAPTATLAILVGLAFTMWWFPQRPPLPVEFAGALAPGDEAVAAVSGDPREEQSPPR